jgi:hypothetical protein
MMRTRNITGILYGAPHLRGASTIVKMLFNKEIKK